MSKEIIQYLLSELNQFSYDYDKFHSLKDKELASLRLPKYIRENGKAVTSLICYEETMLLADLALKNKYRFKVVLLETIDRKESGSFRIEDHFKFFIHLPENGWVLLGRHDPEESMVVLETAPTWSRMERKVREHYRYQDLVQISEIDIMSLLISGNSTIPYTEFQEYLKSIKTIRDDIVDYTIMSRCCGSYNEVLFLTLKSGERLYFN